MRGARSTELSEADFVSRSHAFFGRTGELDQLIADVPSARPGRPLVRFVVGAPGVGKSALLQRACGRLVSLGALVLSSRCAQQGARPYRAIDGALEAIARHWSELPDARREALLPLDAALLGRVFPAFIRALPPGAMGDDSPLQPLEQRNRAFVALRELLRKLTQERSVVLALDDLHWLDADSLSLLRTLLRGPTAPGLSVLGTLQPEGEPGLPEHAVSVSELQRVLATSGKPLVLHGLDTTSAARLAEQLLSVDAPSRRAEAVDIARDAAGHPRLIEQWVLVLKESPQEVAAGSLVDLLRNRLRQLRPAARELASLVALADGPVALCVLEAASGVDAQAIAREAAALRLSRLCRVTQSSDGQKIELTHERFREVALCDLSNDEQQRRHAALACAYERLRPLDEEALARHLHLAGYLTRAAEAYVRAADRALEALAFARAARLYGKSIALSGGNTEPERHARLGDALSSGGHAADAARAYLAAAHHDQSLRAFDLRRRALELLLVCGHADAGKAEAAAIIARLRLPLGTGRLGNFIGSSARWLRLRATGTSFRERDAFDIPTQKLLRIDTCWSLFVGLLNEDPIRADHALALHVTESLAAGEPVRVARGLAGMALMLEMTRGQSARAQELSERAASIVSQLDCPHVRGLCHLHAGMRAFHGGHPGVAKAELALAEQAFLSVAGATPWELGVTQFSALLCHMLSGDLPTLRRLAHDWHEDALARGDLNAARNLCSRVLPAVALLSDDCARARSWLLQAGEPFGSALSLQAYWREVCLIECALLDSGQEALARMETLWSRLKRSPLMLVRAVHTETHWMRARTWLAALDEGAPERCEQVALAEAGELDACDMAGASGLAWCVRGAVYARHDTSSAREAFQRAQGLLHESGYELLAKLAQLRRGLIGEDAAAEREVREAERWLVGAGIDNPHLILRVQMPGALRTHARALAPRVGP